MAEGIWDGLGDGVLGVGGVGRWCSSVGDLGVGLVNRLCGRNVGGLWVDEGLRYLYDVFVSQCWRFWIA